VVPQLYQQQQQLGQQQQSVQQHQQPSQPQHQQQMLLQQQQQSAVPLGERPWAWWRSPGDFPSILLGELDRVRQPLLQLHAAHGDTCGTTQLLQAMGHSISRDQPGSSAAAADGAVSSAAAGCSGAAQLGECWQQLVAEGQRLASPRKPQGQALQQQNQQQQVLDLGAAAAAGGAAGALSGADAAASSGVNGSTCSKPPKRPWQPKMASDESNWSQVRLTGRGGGMSGQQGQLSSVLLSDEPYSAAGDNRTVKSSDQGQPPFLIRPL
jgi:hypothetical protein